MSILLASKGIFKTVSFIFTVTFNIDFICSVFLTFSFNPYKNLSLLKFFNWRLIFSLSALFSSSSSFASSFIVFNLIFDSSFLSFILLVFIILSSLEILLPYLLLVFDLTLSKNLTLIASSCIFLIYSIFFCLSSSLILSALGLFFSTSAHISQYFS